LTALLPLLLYLPSPFSFLQAQSSDAAIDDLVRMTDKEIARLEREGRKIGRVEFGRISADSIAFSFREMHRGLGKWGNEYEIVAFASQSEVEDVDIFLLEMKDGEPQLIMQNRSDLSTAKLHFFPAENKTYAVSLKGYGFKTDDQEAQFAIIVAYNNF
ncbi:MAG: hypothetical protein AAFU03_16260, partial [Bacteroidota bacterium]